MGSETGGGMTGAALGWHGELVEYDIPGDTNPPGGREINIVSFGIGSKTKMYAFSCSLIHLREDGSCYYGPSTCTQIL